MGRVFFRVNDILVKFVGRILGFESGGFVLGYGHHEVTVPFEISPRNLWIDIEQNGKIDGCGQIPINKVGYMFDVGESEKEFIRRDKREKGEKKEVTFVVDVETETCEVKWFAVE